MNSDRKLIRQKDKYYRLSGLINLLTRKAKRIDGTDVERDDTPRNWLTTNQLIKIRFKA